MDGFGALSRRRPPRTVLAAMGVAGLLVALLAAAVGGLVTDARQTEL
jgi:hypothetical protein